MLKANLRKIKSAPKFAPIAVGIIAAAALLWVVLAELHSDTQQEDYLLRTENQTFALDAATSPIEQAQGLGGRASMPANSGMIFVFARDTRQCFWMKDMQFPLDIIWADSQKRVTHIATNLSPDTYPKTYCAGGKYVFELHAHKAAVGGINAGQKLNF
jgi:uncharacterized membrane protein (UPF0127 family)